MSIRPKQAEISTDRRRIKITSSSTRTSTIDLIDSSSLFATVTVLMDTTVLPSSEGSSRVRRENAYTYVPSSLIDFSEKVEEALARDLSNETNDFVENSLSLAFLQTSKELLESSIDCTFSGSTCSLLLIMGILIDVRGECSLTVLLPRHSCVERECR